jgi:hypothetical protein
MKNLIYETEPCGRCGGSGWHSYCELWGNTCFECGVRAHQRGTGRRFTKRAKAAMAAVRAFIREQFARRADAVQPGMLFIPHGNRPVKVVNVGPSGSGVMRPDGSISYGIDIQTAGCCYCYQPDSFLNVIPSDAEWNQCVVPFARTLIGVSVDGDVPVGVFKMVAGKGGKRVDYVVRCASVPAALAFIANEGPKVRRRMFLAAVEHDAGRSKSWMAA